VKSAKNQNVLHVIAQSAALVIAVIAIAIVDVTIHANTASHIAAVELSLPMENS
jgi:hypothetical protein